jgi:hypothetical protein
MLDGRDQLPLGPHANRVLVHRFVDDRESDERGQFEILQADADLGGALSNEANVRRSGDDLVDAAHALCGTVDAALKRQPGDRRQCVSIKLKRVRTEIKRIQASHPEFHELRQPAQVGRKPCELIVADPQTRGPTDLSQITSKSSRVSHIEPLELCQLADFGWQRRELVAVGLNEHA